MVLQALESCNVLGQSGLLRVSTHPHSICIGSNKTDYPNAAATRTQADSARSGRRRPARRVHRWEAAFGVGVDKQYYC